MRHGSRCRRAHHDRPDDVEHRPTSRTSRAAPPENQDRHRRHAGFVTRQAAKRARWPDMANDARLIDFLSVRFRGELERRFDDRSWPVSDCRNATRTESSGLTAFRLKVVPLNCPPTWRATSYGSRSVCDVRDRPIQRHNVGQAGKVLGLESRRAERKRQ